MGHDVPQPLDGAAPPHLMKVGLLASPVANGSVSVSYPGVRWTSLPSGARKLKEGACCHLSQQGGSHLRNSESLILDRWVCVQP